MIYYKDSMDSNSLNKKMIEGQIKPLGNINKTILDAFLSVPRDSFVPKDLNIFSYLEKHLELKNQRFLLKSSLIAKIISCADIRPEDAVLVIGSSTGYSSAVLSKVAETVISIEENQDLISFSENSIKKSEIDNVIFIKKDLADGCPEHGLFSRIIIEGAIESKPKNILDQLEDNGKLIVIYKKDNICEVGEYTKIRGNFNYKFLFNCEAPLLNSFNKNVTFSF